MRVFHSFSILFLLTLSIAHSHAKQPHVVFILADDMGYGDLGCYNPESKIPTPNIDSIAREGMRFTDAHSGGPVCVPSRYSLLTGRYAFRREMAPWREEPLIADGQPTIASVLKTQGYRTAMVGKWHLGFREEGYDKPLPGGPVDRGFDSYFGIRASTDIPPYFYIRDNRAVEAPTDHIEAHNTEGWSDIQGAYWREGGIAPGFKLEEVTPRFTEEAVGVIEDHAASKTENPLFLYLAFPSPHTPWLPSATFEGKSGAGLYGDFLTMVDAQVGKVLAALERAGMKENTLLFFSSDNGPIWYDRDVERFGHDSTGGLRGMKADTWEGGHRVPLIVRWPGVVEAGSVSHHLVSFTDLLATLAAVSGAELPAEAGPDSFSFLPVLQGTQDPASPVREFLVVTSSHTAIRSGPWKYIDHLGSGGFISQPRTVEPEAGGPTGQLYNLEKDLGETTNLALEHPEIVERLSAELERILGSERTRTSQQ
jgi:arylsulfatase A-like enzyme